MCVGIPMQVVSVDKLSARVTDGDREAVVDLALVGPQPPGTWLLIFLGAAREVLDPARAALIRDALAGLASALAGGDPGDAFADLDARVPALPPHLEAAQRAGARTA